MLIIVEGVDRCGKSTLIKQLRKEVFTNPKTTSIHCSIPPSDADSRQWSYTHYKELLSVVAQLVADGWTIILDRSHLSEDIYGPLYRNDNTNYIYDLEYTYLFDTPTKLIVVVDAPESIVNRDDGESLSKDIKDVQSVCEGFEKVYTKTLINDKMLYNISEDGGFRNLFSTVKEFINANS